MNTDFIYYNGKATILDSNGSEKEIDYYDKLEEVLERENLIEVLENKSICLKDDIIQINKNYKKSRKEYIDAVLWFLFPLIIYSLSLIFTHFFCKVQTHTCRFAKLSTIMTCKAFVKYPRKVFIRDTYTIILYNKSSFKLIFFTINFYFTADF